MKRTRSTVVLPDTCSINSKQKTQGQILAGILAQWIGKNFNSLVAVAAAFSVLTQGTKARAGLFDPAEQAMRCMFNTSNGNTLLQALPTVIFAALNLTLFIGLLTAAYQVFDGVQQGKELTQVAQMPLVGFVVLLILFIFQSILFTGNACA
ncbi:hypothetical protein WKK05_37655 (plasmid) [Nostoc sp. UHCC 0302]|uniref:hypothetical protein n=1 Tax=Nostoc sp. UHCC 0302 TaxID=3134896 RepID=UPI00311CA078